jgi:hypothetical protein
VARRSPAIGAPETASGTLCIRSPHQIKNLRRNTLFRPGARAGFLAPGTFRIGPPHAHQDPCVIFLPKLTYQGAIGAVAHRLAGLVWKILRDGVSYIEQGQDTAPRAKKRRAQKLAQALRKLGYSVTLTEVNPGTVPAANARFSTRSTPDS